MHPDFGYVAAVAILFHAGNSARKRRDANWKEFLRTSGIYAHMHLYVCVHICGNSVRKRRDANWKEFLRTSGVCVCVCVCD